MKMFSLEIQVGEWCSGKSLEMWDFCQSLKFNLLYGGWGKNFSGTAHLLIKNVGKLIAADHGVFKCFVFCK